VACRSGQGQVQNIGFSQYHHHDQTKALGPSNKNAVFDNGKDFAEHSKMDAAFNSTTYFPDPFASWQRGSNENFNGLLR
jgi:IS30 family transposase